MKRTISAMVGKGSVNHNSRKFKAENVDGSRTHLNIDYCNVSLSVSFIYEVKDFASGLISKEQGSQIINTKLFAMSLPIM